MNFTEKIKNNKHKIIRDICCIIFLLIGFYIGTLYNSLKLEYQTKFSKEVLTFDNVSVAINEKDELLIISKNSESLGFKPYLIFDNEIGLNIFNSYMVKINKDYKNNVLK